jgi:hypothetical protein
LISPTALGKPRELHQCKLPQPITLLTYNTSTKTLQAVIVANQDQTKFHVVTIDPHTCTWTVAATWTPARSPFTFAISLALGVAVGIEPISDTHVRPYVYQLQGAVFQPAPFTCAFNWSAMGLPTGGPSGFLLAGNDGTEPVYVFADSSASCMLRLLHLATGCQLFNFSDARSDGCHPDVSLESSWVYAPSSLDRL